MPSFLKKGFKAKKGGVTMNKLDTQETRTLRICDHCGFENESKNEKCLKCGRNRFAPNWIIAKKPITRQTSVDVTLSNPNFGEQAKRITLNKWWPGGRATFHITDPELWNNISQRVEELHSIAGWEAPNTLVTRLTDQSKTGDQKEIVDSLKELFSQYPDLLFELGKVLDPENITKKEISELASALTLQASILTQGKASFREAYIKILNQLPNQPQQALTQLENLLEHWSLQQITSVAQTIKSRLDTIELFRSQVENDKTFEIIGENSIHRILEKAMWMIDERYILLKSNKTLRHFIGEAMSKTDVKKYGKQRPDFVCGSVGDKLIIIELKRPGKTLTIDDLTQLETYLTVATSYVTKYKSYDAYLVGNKQDDDLVKRSKFRSSIFKIMTYTDLLDNTEIRYKEYLEFVESES